MLFSVRGKKKAPFLQGAFIKERILPQRRETECCLCVHDGDTVHLWSAHCMSSKIKQLLVGEGGGTVCVEIGKRKEVEMK